MILGEIRKAKELGRKGTGHYTWAACIDCGKKRWVLVNKYKESRNLRCGHCACLISAPLKVKKGSNHPNWKGGRYLSVHGYIEVRVDVDSLFYPMARTGQRVYEHRLVMAQKLGRCLNSCEIVHHLNGIRTDNRQENLCIVDSHKHDKTTLVKQLQHRIRQLEKEVD